MNDSVAEAEDWEEKSLFQGTEREWLELVKTLVSMANSTGGQVLIRDVTCAEKDLDSARLDDIVNRYVSPRVRNIQSRKLSTGAWTISVPRCTEQLHIFHHEASYQDARNIRRSAFYPGQIYVRHSSKTEPATADDLRRFLRDTVADWMAKLGEGIKSLGLDISSANSAMPVRLADEPGALVVNSDANKLYPYTARTLGVQIGKDQNWIARAAANLGLKSDLSCCWGAKSAGGGIVVWKYSQRARELLEQKLLLDPHYDPYRAASPLTAQSPIELI
jgi:hypothetical protein